MSHRYPVSFRPSFGLALGKWSAFLTKKNHFIGEPHRRFAVPPHTSNCVSIVKDTSLASVVAMPDLLKQATDAQALMANPTPLIGAALIYLAILWPAIRLVAYLEARSASLTHVEETISCRIRTAIRAASQWIAQPQSPSRSCPMG